MVVCYGRFGTSFRFCLQGSVRQRTWVIWHLKMGPIGCPETSLTDYRSALRRIPADRISYWHRGGNLESRKCGNFLDTNNVQSVLLKTKSENTAKVMALHFRILHSRLCVCVCIVIRRQTLLEDLRTIWSCCLYVFYEYYYHIPSYFLGSIFYHCIYGFISVS
jgi:hypothetical protein